MTCRKCKDAGYLDVGREDHDFAYCDECLLLCRCDECADRLADGGKPCDDIERCVEDGGDLCQGCRERSDDVVYEQARERSLFG